MKCYMKKHLKTKHNIFWFQVRDIKISDIFYKIPKFLRMSWAPIITTNGINFFMVKIPVLFAKKFQCVQFDQLL